MMGGGRESSGESSRSYRRGSEREGRVRDLGQPVNLFFRVAPAEDSCLPFVLPGRPEI